MNKVKIISLALCAAALFSSCAYRLVNPADTNMNVTRTAVNTADAADTADTVTDDTAGAAAEITNTDEASVPATETSSTACATTGDSENTASYIPIVFMYHLVMEEPYSIYENLFVRPSEFARQLDILNESGCTYLFADEYGMCDSPSVILTFDDGYEDNYTTVYPMLKEKGAKATIFVVTSLIGTDGYLTEPQIKEMSDSGIVSIQTHTVSHYSMAYMNSAQLAKEIDESAARLEMITGKKVTAIAYPAGDYNDAAIAAVGERLQFAYTTKQPDGSLADNFTIPRYRIPRGCSDAYIRSLAGIMSSKATNVPAA